jgi:hypothetical protein
MNVPADAERMKERMNQPDSIKYGAFVHRLDIYFLGVKSLAQPSKTILVFCDGTGLDGISGRKYSS